MTDPSSHAAVPPEPGTVPSSEEPDPAPEREVDARADTDERDRGGTGEPVGEDNIREGRVDGIIGPSHQSQGQGQGQGG
ncbi:MAG: hypothetical protein ACJ77N_16270 [Chloroflexota bacterium]|jgi:hypothetical protein